MASERQTPEPSGDEREHLVPGTGEGDKGTAAAATEPAEVDVPQGVASGMKEPTAVGAATGPGPAAGPAPSDSASMSHAIGELIGAGGGKTVTGALKEKLLPVAQAALTAAAREIGGVKEDRRPPPVVIEAPKAEPEKPEEHDEKQGKKSRCQESCKCKGGGGQCIPIPCAVCACTCSVM